MTKVLFITEKYHSPGNLTNNEYNLNGSWDCAGLGERENYYICPEEIWSTQQVDEVLMSKTYDLAVVSVYHHMPSIETCRKLRNRLCMFWWDAIVSMHPIRHYAKEGKCNQIIFDHGKGNEEHNIWSMEVPQDSKYFYKDDNVVKDIDVSFVGSVDSARPDRAIIRDKLIEAGITNIHFGGGRGGGYANLSIEEYTNLFRRSKINLNLQRGHGNQKQRKGRAGEISAIGGFMMSTDPEMFSGKEGHFFTDGEDYISFDENNLVEKVNYYLTNEEERNRISNNLWNKYQSNYTPLHFWNKILKICS